MRYAPPLLLSAALALAACGGSGAAVASSGDGVTGCERPASARVAQGPPPAPAPPPVEPSHADVRGQSAALDAAVAAYDGARFDEAAAQFEAVASGGNGPVQRVALRLLGRTRLALGDRAGATEALRQLVATEPPQVRLDPDVEPLALLESFYEVRRDADGSYAVGGDRGTVLAIADFTNGSITDHDEVDPLRLGFPALMIDRMRGSTELTLVERVRLQWLLDEAALGTGESAGREAGRLLGADQVVFGTYIKSGSDLLMTARVVDVDTGRILLAERVEGRAADFDDLVLCLSDLIAGAVDVQLPAPDMASAPPQSLDAVIAYARGLALEESEDYAGAAAQYELALSIDPSYARAESRLTEGVEPFMASNQ